MKFSGEYSVLARAACQQTINHVKDMTRHSRLKIYFCLLMFFALTFSVFYAFYLGFSFLASFSVIGPFIADRLLFMFVYSLFLMLFCSAAVTAYMVLYKGEDTVLLFTLPVSWEALWTKKILEIFTLSAWALLLLAIPFTGAYGFFKQASWQFYAGAPLVFMGLSALTCAAGGLATVFFMYVFRNPRLRQWLLWLSVAGGISYLLLAKHPQPAENSFNNPAVFFNQLLPYFRSSLYPFMPNYWASQGLVALAGGQWKSAGFYGALLATHTLFLFQIGFLLAPWVYRDGWFALRQASSRRRTGRGGSGEALNYLLNWLPRPWRALAVKDLRLFLRDPAQWAQFLIFFGILAVYFVNLDVLKVKLFENYWRNLIFLVNMASIFMTLASLTGRFAFPLFSMEGNRFWIVGMSPLSMREVLREKFTGSFLCNLLLVIPLTLLVGIKMQVGNQFLLTGIFFAGNACFALTAMAVGMGAIFPDFKSDNPVKIVSGFSGTLTFILELIYVTAATAFLTFSLTPSRNLLCVSGIFLLSLAYGGGALWLAGKKLDRLEY